MKLNVALTAFSAANTGFAIWNYSQGNFKLAAFSAGISVWTALLAVLRDE